ncbi:MAG: isoleucine--tRNA ligase [Desulfovibrionaceae bacterium]|nr:isoleucine--tRNA ligase [Desulfovibrionaceae bacterium]
MGESNKKDYKKTLNLPVTSFPMKANLVQREPAMLAHWNTTHACEAMETASGSRGTYVLHDGPPYANGHLHMGHALNKILKDIIVKSRNMQGYACHYVPGWDCHGLPIELKVEQELKGKKKELPTHVVRRLCREYATKWVNVQREEFRRLGVLGDWDNPYLSMTPAYEAVIARELTRFVARGSVVRDKKPVYWCCSCHTALAEAEVEYADIGSPSIYVAFPLPDHKLADLFPGCDPAHSSIVIWTTTPWTIPDNMAVCVHPEFTYELLNVSGHFYLLAAERRAQCAELFGWHDYTVLSECAGQALEGLIARHPFYDRESKVILGGHVTLDAGTGCVHTAPGHGREDYEVGQIYNLPIYSPLDDAGRFLNDVEYFKGKTVFEANPLVIGKLAEVGALLHAGTIEHSYPHCWRCKKPVIFRATPQWFIRMETNDLRKKALSSIDRDVRWIPAWGRERIYGMIETRPDWCISRQRQWGVPIMALRCEDCGEVWNDASWMDGLCDRFAAHPTGCDYWYEAPLDEIVPKGLTCPHCGGSHWVRENDILDVWFDSGSSWAAVLEARSDLSFPADLYLEGSDQHRGWFHSSLLVAQGTRDTAPYRAVLTHGYVVDGEGRKMSKSVGNVIAPQSLIDTYGAEIVRLWASSVDYREDIRLSDQIVSRLVDAYRRIRNTCRFLLGNLYDFTELLPLAQLLPQDRYALDRAARLHTALAESYREYEFHKVYHGLHACCVTDLSALYLDTIKDRLYAEKADGILRRSAQTAIYLILNLLLRDMAPILSFTAEEIFLALPETIRPKASTVFALQDEACDEYLLPDDVVLNWQILESIRAAVTRAIEPLRTAHVVGHSLDTRLVLYLESDKRARIESLGADLRAYFIVSQLVLDDMTNAPADALTDPEVQGVALHVEKASGEKCERCWIYSTELGQNPKHPTLCPRCASVLEG